MILVPVVTPDGPDILSISTALSRGDGSIFLVGPISLEIEDELKKALRFATELASFGEFRLPDFSLRNIHISFKLRRNEIPIVGDSYGLGLGVAILSLFAGRSGQSDCCFTGAIAPDGSVLPVEGLTSKISGAVEDGIKRIYLPKSQLNFFENRIEQIPVEDIYETWGSL